MIRGGIMFRNLKKQIGTTKRQMKQLDDEFINLSELNKAKSSQISKSIQQKSGVFKDRKEQRSKHFNVIRNR
jgi:Sec-independent protein translocase protein TatA